MARLEVRARLPRRDALGDAPGRDRRAALLVALAIVKIPADWRIQDQRRAWAEFPATAGIVG